MKLHQYQVLAIEHLHTNPKAALWLDCGLGKSAVTLRALTPDHLPVLVTAPKRVTENVWALEAQLWRPDLTIEIAAGDPKKRKAALESGADIVVISRDNLADAVPYASLFRTFVIDESSGFKTRASKRWKTAHKIVKDMPHVWQLSATPAPNGLIDIWSQIVLLDGGERLGKTLTAYRGRYFKPGMTLANGVVTEWIIRPEADKHIHELLEDIALSMENRLDIPPVTFNTVAVPLPAPVFKLYEVLRETLVADLEVLGGEVHTAGNAAILSSKLSQITAGFMYVDDADLRDGQYDVLHKEKVAAIIEIVEGTGSPVLVFYQFKAERDLIAAAMPTHSIDEPNIVARWNAGEIPVLLVHPAAAGHGLNLQTGGHTIIWATLPWSLESWEQGNGRLARQGQKHPVVIHALLSPHTVDGAIQARLRTKTSVQQALLDHLRSPI